MISEIKAVLSTYLAARLAEPGTTTWYGDAADKVFIRAILNI